MIRIVEVEIHGYLPYQVAYHASFASRLVEDGFCVWNQIPHLDAALAVVVRLGVGMDGNHYHPEQTVLIVAFIVIYDELLKLTAGNVAVGIGIIPLQVPLYDVSVTCIVPAYAQDIVIHLVDGSVYAFALAVAA